MKYFLSTLFLFAIVILNGQIEQFRDEIKFFNGHVIRGEVLDYKVGEYIVFKMKGGNILEIPVHDVARIFQKREGPNVMNPNRFRNKGFYNATTASMSFNETMGYSLTHVLGHRFNRYYSLGIGSGLENYEDGEGKKVVPIFVESRGFLWDKKLTPYFSLRLGYGIGLKK